MLIRSLYKSLENINKDIPLIAKKQWTEIPKPIPKAAMNPDLRPCKVTCLIIIAVSGPGLVSAMKWAIDDHINIISK